MNKKRDEDMDMKVDSSFKLLVLLTIILISEKGLLAETNRFHSKVNGYSLPIRMALMHGSFQLDPDTSYRVASVGPGFWERRAMEAVPIIALTFVVASIGAVSGGISCIIKRHKDKKETEQPILQGEVQLSRDNERQDKFTCPHRFTNSLHKCNSYIADSLRLGGKQMLCDIIKWTIIIIIAAIVLAVAYKIAVSSGQKGIGAL